MSENNHQSNYIDILQLLQILWRWKFLIISGTLLTLGFAFLYSQSVEKLYKYEMVIRPGIVSINQDGKVAYIDTPQNIKALVDTDSFKNKILQSFRSGLEDKKKKTIIEFKVALPRNTNSIKINLLTNHREEGGQILNQLKNLIKKQYDKNVQLHKANYTQSIESTLSELKQLSETKRNFKNNISVTNTRMIELKREIETVEQNTKRLSELRDRYISENATNDQILTTLIYSNTIQQNLQLTNSLKNELNQLELGQAELKEKLNLQASEIEIKNAEIANLRIKRDSIENISVVQEPFSNRRVQKPKVLINLAVGFIAGLLATVLLAFVLEYLKKRKA